MIFCCGNPGFLPTIEDDVNGHMRLLSLAMIAVY